MSDEQLDARRSARAANLFDVRRMIGGLLGIYGLILLVLGIGASDADIEKAAGVNLNLWTGLALLLVGGLFLLWAFLRPLSEELGAAEPDEDDRTVKGAHAPSGPDAAALPGSETVRRRPRRDRDRPGGQSPSRRE